MFSWPPWGYVPLAGLDPGWVTGLQLAQSDGLSWGRDVIYTYGPLGFVVQPQVWNLTGLIGGLLYNACAVLTITVVPYVLLRRQLSQPPALVLTAAIALAAPTSLFLPELLSLGAFLLAVGVFQGMIAVRPTVIAGALGGLVGVQALVKPSTAIIAALACLLVVVSPTPGVGRRVTAAAGGVVVAFVGGWLVLGQSLSDLPDWMRSVADLARFYSEATFVAPVDKVAEFLGAAGMIVGVVVYATRYATRMPKRSSWIIIAACVATVWLTSKEAFVSHDVHSAIFFFTVAVFAVAIRTSPPRPVAQLSMIVATGLVLATLAAGSTLDEAVDPTGSVHSFLSLVTYIIDPGNRAAETDAARAQLQAADALPDPVREAASAGTVHVDPVETSLVWAYGFRWKPVPVFQRYAAFTRRSDETNARALETRATAPDHILRQQTAGFGGRNDLWDSPRYMLNLVCFYRQTLVAAPWQVLEWAPSRCGQMHYTKAISFRADETFTVPRGSDNQLVVVWLDVHRSLWERLRTFLFRPASPILVDTGTGEFRMATTQVTGPLLMSIPTTVGWDGAFGGGVDYRSLRVNRDGTARFATVPLS